MPLIPLATAQMDATKNGKHITSNNICNNISAATRVAICHRCELEKVHLTKGLFLN